MASTKVNVLALAERDRWQRPEWEGLRWRRRKGAGGGFEYHYSCLPAQPQTALVLRLGHVEIAQEREIAREKMTRAQLWEWFDAQSAKKKADARERLEALDRVELLCSAGMGRVQAMQMVRVEKGVTLASMYSWAGRVRGVERHDWLPYLVSHQAGGNRTAECSPEAWEFLKADFLRPERPNFTDCYERLLATAKVRGWHVPGERTLMRRIEAIPETVRVLARDGVDALKRMYPAQERDRSAFHALEAVNADGHKADVFVKWSDGRILRPILTVFQDLYSGLILSWRVDVSENTEAVRLAFGDLVEAYGIPEHCWLDNGRQFASKWLTGGTPNRFRFKVKEEEPAGILTTLGVKVHWTTPYSGQSKPIERAFRDLAQGLWKHPAFAGAYTGNNPMAKPENYASKAVDLETFLKVTAAGINAHNDRIGRDTRVCGGKLSFRQAFDASYATAVIRKATAEQRRLWLLAAEAIRVRRTDGSIEIEGNRYWSERLLPLRGQRVTVRFDPQALHGAVHVYRTDGAFVCSAECVEAAGFADVDAAREHGRKRRAFLRLNRELLETERSMSIAEVAAMLPEAPEPAPPPETKLVALVRGATALKPVFEEEEKEERDLDLFVRAVELQREQRAGGRLSLVLSEEDDGEV
ncbi:MAG: transposase domain-containing protein [Roseomonas mucosa]|nr:transposase domain-containing protein [Roseomonas mucosa]